MLLTKTWFRLLLAAIILSASGAAMILSASFLYLGPHLPPAAQLRETTFQIPLRIYASSGELIGEYGEQRRTPISFDQVPPQFVQALTSAEDERFFRHNGVDLKGLTRAASELLRYREIRSGGSTITMQVARNFFLSREQSFLRKFNEIVLAIQIENILSKEEIFELYINKIYLGHRAYGVEAAAQVYYGKSLGELDLPQLAMIAGLPKAPSAYNPLTNPQRALARRDWILERMLERRRISPEQYQQAVATPNTARHHGTALAAEASYAAEMVRQEALALIGPRIYTDGIRITTTLDVTMQKAAVSSLRHGLHVYDERHGWRGAEGRVDISALPPLPAGSAALSADEASSDTPESDTEDTTPQHARLAQVSPAQAEWAAALRDYQRIGELEPALVAEVQAESVRLVLPHGQLAVLPWAQMEWARRYINASTVGARPEKPSDVLAPGDIVRLRPVASEGTEGSGETVWRLAQIPAAQAALVALDPQTGAIRAIQGGYSFALSNYNRAVQAERQAGSAFKPFVYAAGIDRGITPATLINDAPIVFQDDLLEDAWRPTGASNRFYGPTRVRDALARSLNLVSIRLLQQVGIGNTLRTLNDFGLPAGRFPRDLSLALGSASVTPLEMTAGYAVFANGGYYLPSWLMHQIHDNEGNLLWQAPEVVLCEPDACGVNWHSAPQQLAETDSAEAIASPLATDAPEQLAPLIPPAPEYTWQPRTLDARTAWLMDSMLRDVIRRGTAGTARSLGRADLGGKTGSTNDYIDAWFAGYTPGGVVATAWAGFDAPATLGNGEFGGRVALPMWIDFMGQILDAVPEQTLPQPPGIVSVRINPENGLRARPGDSSAIFEYFRDDSLPEFDDSLSAPGYSGGEEQVRPEDLF